MLTHRQIKLNLETTTSHENSQASLSVYTEDYIPKKTRSDKIVATVPYFSLSPFQC